jgi:hypothetical protein
MDSVPCVLLRGRFPILCAVNPPRAADFRDKKFIP